MKILVLGGCGIQGQGALYDLSRNPRVSEIVCGDVDVSPLARWSFLDQSKIRGVALDAAHGEELAALMGSGVDGVVDLMPQPLMVRAVEAAIAAGVPLVTTNYAAAMAHLDESARERGVAILPECGFDPGIDLVLYGYGRSRLDSITRLDSYCGGIPAPEACDNPLNYKVSWNWAMVLASQQRPATFIHEGDVVHLPPEQQHDNPMIHTIEFPGLGRLEAVPNGDAVHFAHMLGIGDSVVNTGRYSLRWPGWCEFWRPLNALGFLGDTPVPGLPEDVTPRRFLEKLLEPRLQYGPRERDLALMVNVFEGKKKGAPTRITYTIRVDRDLSTGIMGMAQAVSFPACVALEMLVSGEIAGKGILSPVCDIPAKSFLKGLASRGIEISEQITPLSSIPA